MAARVSNKVGLESDAQNFLLIHAMGPNVAGVIGSTCGGRDAEVRAGDVLVADGDTHVVPFSSKFF